MRPMHTNPSDALQIHQDVRSKKSIGVHCCTFYLTTGKRGKATHTRGMCKFLMQGRSSEYLFYLQLQQDASCACTCQLQACCLLTAVLPLLLLTSLTALCPLPHVNTLEPMDEPPKLLQQCVSEAGLDPQSFVTLQHGAMLQTRDGRDSNTPPLLPLAAAASQAAAAAADASSS